MKWNLPDVKNEPVDYPHFPTRQQLFVWKNWGMVDEARLADVLQTSVENVIALAEGMGLPAHADVTKEWLERGYITIIRANWHILPYDQLLTLLGWSEERLGFTLKEDDFLSHKLGNFKPDAKTIVYNDLTEQEKQRTAEIKYDVEQMREEFGFVLAEQPFAFLNELQGEESVSIDSSHRAEADEICLDDQWGVVFSETAANSRIDIFVKRFIDKVQKRFGIQLHNDRDSTCTKRIELSVRSADHLPAESHSILIGPDHIAINGCDEVGVWRGLQHLVQVMTERRAPYLTEGYIERMTRYDLRFNYSHFAVYGDPLLEPELDPYPDELLERLSDLGINGIWLQGILYQLIPWSEAPERSLHWEIRLDNLRKLVDRAASYGIGVYLYLNEPRAMPISFFEQHPEWKGHELDGYACLCTSQPEVLSYVRESCAELFKQVSELAGVFTITMSENLTNCYSRSYPNAPTNCQRCAQRPINEIVAEVNRMIAEGIYSVNKQAKVLCWTWGYTYYRGWTPEIMQQTVNDLPANVSLMSTSEFELETHIGGVPSKLSDYSISQVGPSTKSKRFWEMAASRKLTTVAKVQFNTSWECAAIPYLPVIPLIEEHLHNLEETSVTGLMLSWTLGGYPSMTLEYASHYYWNEAGKPPMDTPTFAVLKFGTEVGQVIAEAWIKFSQAFHEFPLCGSLLYTGPQNVGPANPLYLKPTRYNATMVGFPYDDLKTWRGNYPEEIFAEQLRKIVMGWREGLILLKAVETKVEPHSLVQFREMQRMALATYHHFCSAWHQTEFILLREKWNPLEEGSEKSELAATMRQILIEERKLAGAHAQLMGEDSKIGFEASCHYFYTRQDLMEKVLNCNDLLKELSIENY